MYSPSKHHKVIAGSRWTAWPCRLLRELSTLEHPQQWGQCRSQCWSLEVGGKGG